MTKDYDAAMDAFETIADHLARIKIVAANESLREPSVRVLSQTLVVMGVITQLQRDGRFSECYTNTARGRSSRQTLRQRLGSTSSSSRMS